MTVTSLAQVLAPTTLLNRERLREYLREAGLEFSFTGFSSFSALARRTLQLAAAGGQLDGLAPEDREPLLSEPDGTVVREVVSLIAETPDFPSAWRFVRRDWTFRAEFRSLIGALIDRDRPVTGRRLQVLLAIANGVPIPEDAEVVPLELRRER